MSHSSACIRNRCTRLDKTQPPTRVRNERFAAACSKVRAARWAGFDPTDSLDSLKTPFEKVFVNLSTSRLQNTEQINNKKKRLWGLTFLGLIQ